MDDKTNIEGRARGRARGRPRTTDDVPPKVGSQGGPSRVNEEKRSDRLPAVGGARSLQSQEKPRSEYESDNNQNHIAPNKKN